MAYLAFDEKLLGVHILCGALTSGITGVDGGAVSGAIQSAQAMGTDEAADTDTGRIQALERLCALVEHLHLVVDSDAAEDRVQKDLLALNDIVRRIGERIEVAFIFEELRIVAVGIVLIDPVHLGIGGLGVDVVINALPTHPLEVAQDFMLGHQIPQGLGIDQTEAGVFGLTVQFNVGLCLVGVIIGEFLAARRGLGYLIIYGSQVFQLDCVVLSIVLLCLFSPLFYRVIAGRK